MQITIGYRTIAMHMLLCARGWDCKQLQSDFFFFLHILWSNRPGIIEMFKIDHDSTWADQIWTWVENISVVNLEFDFPSFAELNHDNGLNRLIAALISDYADARLTNFQMLKSSIFLILRCCAAPWKSVRQRVFPSAATDTIGRTKLPSSVCDTAAYIRSLGA